MKAGWKTKMLGDVAEISAGNSAPQDESLFADGTYPFFRTADAGRIRFGDIYESTDYLNEKGVKGLRRYPQGTILFPKSGASTFLNHRVMLGVEGCVSSHLATIVADATQMEPRYLLYFLSTIAAQDLVQDHAYPSLNLPTISGISIQAPPLPEQRRLVGILDEAFAGIATAKANAEKNLQNARALFESHLQSVFTQRGNGWVDRKLGDVFEIGSSKRIMESEWTSAGVPFYGGKEIVKLAKFGSVVSNNYISDEKYRDYASKYDMPRQNDILITARGTIGVGYIVQGGDKFYYKDGNIISMRGKKPTNPHFVLYAFRSNVMTDQFAELAGTTVRHLPIEKAKELVLRMPEFAAQNSVVDDIRKIEAETQRLASLYERKLAALDALKKSLLHQAFTGEL
jgi:type I restriction enzyme S subunit